MANYPKIIPVTPSYLGHIIAELKSIKERYKNRRERLAALKKKVKTSMEQQFDDIFKEVSLI